jgi:hypothetical protein
MASDNSGLLRRCRDQFKPCLMRVCHEFAARFAASLNLRLPWIYCTLAKPVVEKFDAHFVVRLDTSLLVVWRELVANLTWVYCVFDATILLFWRELVVVWCDIVLLVWCDNAYSLTRWWREFATSLLDIWHDYDAILTRPCGILDAQLHVWLLRTWRHFTAL